LQSPCANGYRFDQYHIFNNLAVASTVDSAADMAVDLAVDSAADMAVDVDLAVHSDVDQSGYRFSC